MLQATESLISRARTIGHCDFAFIVTTVERIITMRNSIALFAITLLSATFPYAAHSAHAQLVNSTPADGSVIESPSSSFVVEFSEAVKFQWSVFTHDSKAVSGRIRFTVGPAAQSP